MIDVDLNEEHISRSWRGCGTRLEDECPCPQQPCGYIRRGDVDPDCPQHAMGAFRTIRDSHRPEHCPGHPTDRAEAMGG